MRACKVGLRRRAVAARASRVTKPRDLHRDENIFQRRQRWNQMKRLKDESYFCAPQFRERVFAHLIDGLAVYANLARARRI